MDVKIYSGVGDFSAKELNYITSAVGQFDEEYAPAPDGLREKLEDWRNTFKETCSHRNVVIKNDFWRYCEDCGLEEQRTGW